MGPLDAQRRPGQGAAAVMIDLDEQIATKDSPAVVNGQDTLADARARLLEVIRQKPAPQPDLFDEATWRRNSRGLDAQRILNRISRPYTANVAAALGCTPQSVNNWRRGAHSPTPRHHRQLCRLEDLLVAAREYGRREIDPDFALRGASRGQ